MLVVVLSCVLVDSLLLSLPIEPVTLQSYEDIVVVTLQAYSLLTSDNRVATTRVP